MPSSEILHWRTWSANLLVDLSCSTARTQMSAIFRRAGKRKYLSSKLHVNLKFATGHSHGWILSGWRLVPMMRFCLLLLCFLVIRMWCTVLYRIRAIWKGNYFQISSLFFWNTHSAEECSSFTMSISNWWHASKIPRTHRVTFLCSTQKCDMSSSQPVSQQVRVQNIRSACLIWVPKQINQSCKLLAFIEMHSTPLIQSECR